MRAEGGGHLPNPLLFERLMRKLRDKFRIRLIKEGIPPGGGGGNFPYPG